jgi:hypothetical protein
VSDPDAPPLDTRMLLDALERHKVVFVAVGGLAARWQGAQRQEALPELRELRDGPPAYDDDLYEERGR